MNEKTRTTKTLHELKNNNRRFHKKAHKVFFLHKYISRTRMHARVIFKTTSSTEYPSIIMYMCIADWYV